MTDYNEHADGGRAVKEEAKREWKERGDEG